MLDKRLLKHPEGLRAEIGCMYRAPESQVVALLIKAAYLDPVDNASIREHALRLITTVRSKKTLSLVRFLTEYALSTEEGIALMCLAEALLRVPDTFTMDALIKDKMTAADWHAHQGHSDSLFINATTWTLMLTGNLLSPETARSRLSHALRALLHRFGAGFVRKAAFKTMRLLAAQFIMGPTIALALQRAQKNQTYRYSYDMLGEAAITAADALRYFDAYVSAIHAIGESAHAIQELADKPGISIKLSALHPRYEEAQHERILAELSPKLLHLAQLAKQYNIALMVDAEESERLELSMDLIEAVFTDSSLSGWHGFGMAVQSYQKRAFYLLDWVANLARCCGRRMMVRLIKGAYWDTEIKKAQMQGLDDYPVFTRKVFTDLSFQACAKKILTMTDAIYPQFATHNAYSVALIMRLVGQYRDFELQCLHGMGSDLYAEIVSNADYGVACRIYAPVGSYQDLLPYLVRRLLENGANASFVNRIADKTIPITDLVTDPVFKSTQLCQKPNLQIPPPANIFLPERSNSKGIDWSDRTIHATLQDSLAKLSETLWHAKPIVSQRFSYDGPQQQVYSPQSKAVIGTAISATAEDVSMALAAAESGFATWGKTSVEARVAYVRRFAELLEAHTQTCLILLCLEAGKTWPDASAEVREAVDFCYYYSKEAEKLMAKPQQLHGYTGEYNQVSFHPRGPLLCISPWNFPLAIFVGQIIAALVTGHTVIAKPAEQTPLIAYQIVTWMVAGGFPSEVIQLLLGSGDTVGSALVADQRIKAVLFTGSTQTARGILHCLSKRDAIIPLIAETGGQNAMIVDSSALLEQVVGDVLRSAFGSAGQRCSGLRVLYVQEEIYPRMISLLQGAMAELRIGDPRWLATDIGPVIDAHALSQLQSHVANLLEHYELIYQCALETNSAAGYFMPPTAIAIDDIRVLPGEIFGPVLHVIRYSLANLDAVIAQINATGFGLTLGIHSRIDARIDYIREQVPVGNCYVNRNMIGAVVGLQPFGGEGLSGTGPKAGGVYYLPRLCVERTFTVDTTAAGGNASLMSIPEE